MVVMATQFSMAQDDRGPSSVLRHPDLECERGGEESWRQESRRSVEVNSMHVCCRVSALRSDASNYNSARLFRIMQGNYRTKLYDLVGGTD